MKNRDAKYNGRSCLVVNSGGGTRGSWLFAGALISALVLMARPAAAQETENPFAGLYIGAQAGYAWSDATFTGAPYIANLPGGLNLPVSGRNDKFDLDGGLFGAQLGYNVVTRENILFGIEGDWAYLGNEDSVTGFESVPGVNNPVLFNHRSTLELNWQSTLRGRLGYVSGNTLFFGTAGIAFLNADWKETATANDTNTGQIFVQNHSDSDTLTGFALGGGVEFAVSRRMILGAEYLYENFGSYGSVPFGHSTPAQQGRVGDLDVQKVRVRLNIKLGRRETMEPLK